jgi:pheromone shutdown protein TraB
MATKYIFAVLSAAFLAAALLRRSRGGGAISHPQTRTWLLISGIFAAVSAWLFFQR